MPNEPLWAISFHAPVSKSWLGPYRTATRDLDAAITEARRHPGAPKRAQAGVLPTVPRSDAYNGAKRLLISLRLAGRRVTPRASEMLDQLKGALGAVIEAEEQGRYFGGLTISLPITVQVDEFNVGQPRPVKNLRWMDRNHEWPERNRCTIEPRDASSLN